MMRGPGGKFRHILEHFQDLQARETMWGYFLEPTKIILAMSPQNAARKEELFCGMGIKIVTGSCYLGVFVRDRAAEDSWLAEKVQGWKELAKTLLGVDRKHRQSAYTGLQKSLQQEWAFLQQVTPGIGDAFGPVE